MSKVQCEISAKEMAEKLLRASADALEVQYAIGQLLPLFEMIEEGGDAEEENKRLRAAMQEAVDLLAERKRGNSARSPGHNARLCLQGALKSALPATDAKHTQDKRHG